MTIACDIVYGLTGSCFVRTQIIMFVQWPTATPGITVRKTNCEAKKAIYNLSGKFFFQTFVLTYNDKTALEYSFIFRR